MKKAFSAVANYVKNPVFIALGIVALGVFVGWAGSNFIEHAKLQVDIDTQNAGRGNAILQDIAGGMISESEVPAFKKSAEQYLQGGANWLQKFVARIF